MLQIVLDWLVLVDLDEGTMEMFDAALEMVDDESEDWVMSVVVVLEDFCDLA